jgi:hypothetical protein
MLHVRVRGRAIEVEVVLFDVLPVIALAVRESEHPLLEDRIATVPERQGETKKLLVITDTGSVTTTGVSNTYSGSINNTNLASWSFNAGGIGSLDSSDYGTFTLNLVSGQVHSGTAGMASLSGADPAFAINLGSG